MDREVVKSAEEPMSMRAGWTHNGKHFAETRTERGGLRYFIDGKPTARRIWLAELAAAKAVDQRKTAA